MKKPNNQKELVLWYLYNKDYFSLRDLINDSMFFKFQTRLSELEGIHGKLANRETYKFTNRFGHSSDYNIYSAIDKKQILEIYNKNKIKDLKVVDVELLS